MAGPNAVVWLETWVEVEVGVRVGDRRHVCLVQKLLLLPGTFVAK